VSDPPTFESGDMTARLFSQSGESVFPLAIDTSLAEVARRSFAAEQRGDGGLKHLFLLAECKGGKYTVDKHGVLYRQADNEVIGDSIDKLLLVVPGTYQRCYAWRI
jgi:hypothetical protein